MSVYGIIHLGSGIEFAWSGNGDALWKHPACRSWFHIDLTTGEHHTLIKGEPFTEGDFTIEGSLLCPKDCGTHGFIEDGRWRSA